MKILFTYILLLVSVAGFSQPSKAIVSSKKKVASFVADSAQFTFSLDNTTETAVAGWVQLQPNPNAAILTGSQNGYSISTVATGDANWNDNGLTASAGAVTNSTANSPFPAGVGTGYFFHASTTFVSGGHLRITCPTADAYYDVYVWSMRPTVTDNRLSKIQCIGRYETRTRNNVNSAPSSASSNDTTSQVNTGGTWVRFKNVRPDASNYIFVNAAAETGNTFGYVNALKFVKRSDIIPPEPEPQPVAFEGNIPIKDATNIIRNYPIKEIVTR